MFFPNYYNNIIILCYPRNSGGKLLMSCLSLNDNSIFQNSELAQSQLDGNFNYADKIKYLREQLDDAVAGNGWMDMYLYTGKLFGFPTKKYNIEYPEILSRSLDPVIQKIIDRNLTMHIVAHSIIELDNILKFWPNAKVIIFKNYRNFVAQRFKNSNIAMLHEYWAKIKEPNWPDPPYTFAEFDQLPASIRKELINECGNHIKQLLTKINSQDNNELLELQYELFDLNADLHVKSMGDRCFLWNVDDYGNSRLFLENFKKCQEWAGLPPVNDTDVLEHFERWLKTIKITTAFNRHVEQV